VHRAHADNPARRHLDRFDNAASFKFPGRLACGSCSIRLTPMTVFPLFNRHPIERSVSLQPALPHTTWNVPKCMIAANIVITSSSRLTSALMVIAPPAEGLYPVCHVVRSLRVHDIVHGHNGSGGCKSERDRRSNSGVSAGD